ncbi:MAG: hypothetical protein MMC33_007493 [Icmadophila ericetorum]|nr:hypothetical protein [Icmadophila ericetorum]
MAPTTREISSKLAMYLSGLVIKILAGEEKEVLSVHVELLKVSKSPSLPPLVAESWKESQDWSHTSTDTVKRFITFLYTGDYEFPDPEPSYSEEKPSKLEIISNDVCEIRSTTPEMPASKAFNLVKSPLLPIDRCLGFGISPEFVDNSTAWFEDQFINGSKF